MTEHTSSQTSPFALATAQSRSERTRTRILTAAIAHFEAGTFDATPIAEIARIAEVSVGGIYRRFRNKSDLQRAVAEELMQRLGANVEARLATATAQTTAGGIVQRYAEGLVHGFLDSNAETVRRLSLLMRSDQDLPASQIVQAHNARLQQVLADALRERRQQIDHPDLDAAIAFLDLAVSAAARELMLHAGLGPAPDTTHVIRELTRLGCAYLRTPIPSATTSSP